MTATAPTQPAAPQALPFDHAYAHVHQRVYCPVLFEKLASEFNIRPRNDQEAQELLVMASKLRQAHDTQQERTSQGVLKTAHAKLDAQLAQMGIGPAVQPEQTVAAKTAAANGAKDPALAHAILSLFQDVQAG